MFDIKIDKPLVFFDLETTGTNVQNDRIVELSVVKLLPSGEKEVKTRRINPEMHIPEDATKIHGIKDEDVADSPTFKSVSKNFYMYLEGCDLAGYNIIRFDLPLLIREFSRAQLEFSLTGRRLIDPFVIFCQMEPRNLTAAYKLFCGKELTNAHSAEADTLATIEILEGQLKKYPELPHSLDALHELCDQRDPSRIDAGGRFKWQDKEAIIGFGKNSGTPLRKIAIENPGFLKWMLNSDFPEDAKKIAHEALKGIFPVKD